MQVKRTVLSSCYSTQVVLLSITVGFVLFHSASVAHWTTVFVFEKPTDLNEIRKEFLARKAQARAQEKLCNCKNHNSKYAYF